MRAPVYVLEGADGVGKTVLAGLLLDAWADEHGEGTTAYIHNGPPDFSGSLAGHYRAQLLDAIDFAPFGLCTVIDRSWLSELVYAEPVRGTRTRISAGQAHRLDRLATRHHVTLIGVDAPASLRAARILDRGEEWDPVQHQIAARYRNYFQSSTLWATVESTSAPITN